MNQFVYAAAILGVSARVWLIVPGAAAQPPSDGAAVSELPGVSTGAAAPLPLPDPVQGEARALPLPRLSSAPAFRCFPVASEFDAALKQKFEQTLGVPAVIEFDEAPLREVVAFLRDTYQIPIVLDIRALDNAGLGSDTPVTISLRAVSLRSLLELMLHDLDLTYVIRDQVLQITTPEEAENALHLGIYAVPDLADVVLPARVLDESAGCFETLLPLIHEVIAPDTWSEVGGAGTIVPYEPWRILAVAQTQRNHAVLASLLAALRDVRYARSAADVPSQPVSVTLEADRAAHARIEQVLDTITSVDFTDSPLHDVAKYLEDVCTLPVWIDRRALDDIGVSVDVPVSVSLENVTLRSALRVMLRERELVYVVENEVLKITTASAARNAMKIVVYSVEDFLPHAAEDDTAWDREARLAMLVDVILSAVSPDQWDRYGGTGTIATAEPWGLLVIVQSAEGHAEIQSLLHAARRAREAATSMLMPQPGPLQLVPSEVVSEPTVSLDASLSQPGDAAPAPAPLPLPPATVDQDAMVVRSYEVTGLNMPELVAALRGLVASETWESGATGAVAYPIGDRLLIRQTRAVHRDIGQLLEALRK